MCRKDDAYLLDIERTLRLAQSILCDKNHTTERVRDHLADMVDHILCDKRNNHRQKHIDGVPSSFQQWELETTQWKKGDTVFSVFDSELQFPGRILGTHLVDEDTRIEYLVNFCITPKILCDWYRIEQLKVKT